MHVASQPAVIVRLETHRCCVMVSLVIRVTVRSADAFLLLVLAGLEHIVLQILRHLGFLGLGLRIALFCKSQ